MTTDTELLDIVAPLADRLERIAVALEAIQALVKPSDLATFNASAPRTAPEPRQPQSGPIDPEPPFPVRTVAPSAPIPSQEFRASRDLPAEPFASFPKWSCPVHHGSKTVPAGVSKKTGRPYREFVVCDEPGCDERPPR
jgi:hypothetical protein